MIEDTDPERVIRNVLGGGVSGSTVQAGAVHGGVHFHHPAGHASIPRQLPAPPAAFVGREAELAALDRAWAARDDRQGLALITGPAGVGKSSLALRWAAGVSKQFPDGQLYVDLGAFSPGGPVSPGEVSASFLRALGVAFDRVPAGVAEQVALFRTITAEKGLLILLDNAVSAAQVRQLLPNAPRCMIVVTARWRLGGLASDGAWFIAAEPLDDRWAVELLRRIVGASRVAEHPEAASSLAALCGGLPIALSVLGARLASHPRWSLKRVVVELSDERRRLAGLSTKDDPSVRATLDLSYQSLTSSVAQAYRVLGLHAGGQPSATMVAAVLAVPESQAAEILDTLVEANLLNDLPDDRYQMHDLVRLHAHYHAQADPCRETFTRRITEWYAVTAKAADRLLRAYRTRPMDSLGNLAAPAGRLHDRDDALAWLEREKTNLVATVVSAAETMPHLAFSIADSMWPLFLYRRHHQDRMVVDRIAVQCARRLGERSFEARMLKRWALAHFDIGELDRAAALLESSLGIARQVDDPYEMAGALEGLGMVALARRRLNTAAEYFKETLRICRALGERRRAGLALVNLGTVANVDERPDAAAAFLNEAVVILDELDPYNAARARVELGNALRAAGKHEAGAEEFRRSLADMRRIGSPRGQAQALQALGESAIHAGEPLDALAHLNAALQIYDELGDAEATDVRRLVRLIPPAKADPDRVS